MGDRLRPGGRRAARRIADHDQGRHRPAGLAAQRRRGLHPVRRALRPGRLGRAAQRARDGQHARADGHLTTGGTGPAPRDLTPVGTEAACGRMMPGFGEVLRLRSLEQVPTAILSRQTAGIRGKALVVNLPGRPSSIRVSLPAVMPAVPYCLELIGAARIETDPSILPAFRPAGA
ncbi:molybdopterin adenylyltransferase [Methylobacterium sp. 2A]|nr:molybdopterin adenylyltransferase [Methylobacterium sp. 2A]